jgi:hypothetical protein
MFNWMGVRIEGMRDKGPFSRPSEGRFPRFCPPSPRRNAVQKNIYLAADDFANFLLEKPPVASSSRFR